eukprot:RCo006220
MFFRVCVGLSLGAQQLCYSVMSRTLRKALDVVCVGLGMSLTVVTMLVYVRVVMPAVLDLRSAAGLGVFMLHAWLAFNLLFNYVLAVAVHPGRPTRMDWEYLSGAAMEVPCGGGAAESSPGAVAGGAAA